jgi:hypothetical protein
MAPDAGYTRRQGSARAAIRAEVAVYEEITKTLSDVRERADMLGVRL